MMGERFSEVEFRSPFHSNFLGLYNYIGRKKKKKERETVERYNKSQATWSES